MKRAKRMIIAWLLTLPIVSWMIPEIFMGLIWPNKLIYDLGIIALAAPVLFIAGLPTYRSAIRSIAHRIANMDVLIILGTLMAFITDPLSLNTLLLNYSGVSAMIMSFHLTGRYMEARAKGESFPSN